MDTDDEFSAWYRRDAGRLTSSLALIVADADLARDAIAEAFARAWADWPRVRRMASPSGWVHRVALNEVRSVARSRRTARRHQHRLLTTDPIPAPVEPDDDLWQALAALPERSRTAVALRYVADLPEAEVAEIMGVARGTVAATLHRARRSLHERLVNVEGTIR